MYSFYRYNSKKNADKKNVFFYSTERNMIVQKYNKYLY